MICHIIHIINKKHLYVALVFAKGEEIVCTGGHPLYVPRKGFVQAKALKSTDKQVLSDGKVVEIERIEKEELTTLETTYNFEEEDYHTYYVTESKVLVHNRCKPKMANRGSTGRTEPNNLVEKLAMEQVKADPLDGTEMLNKFMLRDKRWLSSEGWVKMQTVVRSGSHQTTIHFVYNRALNLVDDFKYVTFKKLL